VFTHTLETHDKFSQAFLSHKRGRHDEARTVVTSTVLLEAVFSVHYDGLLLLLLLIRWFSQCFAKDLPTACIER
jgi:hypothetical protein